MWLMSFVREVGGGRYVIFSRSGKDLVSLEFIRSTRAREPDDALRITIVVRHAAESPDEFRVSGGPTMQEAFWKMAQEYRWRIENDESARRVPAWPKVDWLNVKGELSMALSDWHGVY